MPPVVRKITILQVQLLHCGLLKYSFKQHCLLCTSRIKIREISVLQSYFTNGVANSAAKLTTTSKKAWGQTYWTSGGVPTNISGALTDVTDITASGTITANMIIGTSGVSTLSDRKFKTDIKPLEDRGSVQPVTFVKDGKKA